jgi:polar amino acid transport system substrate-binding protein
MFYSARFIVFFIFIFYQNFSCFCSDKIVSGVEKLDRDGIINQCLKDSTKNVLKVGWYDFRPYQYQIVKLANKKLVGLDIAIIRYLAQKVGYKIEFENIEWNIQQQNMMSGAQDIILGATYSDERAEYSYFSLPYRQEETALFLSRDKNSISDFDEVNELLIQLRLQNFRLGTVKEDIYVNPMVMEFINSKNNFDIVKSYKNVFECIDALDKGEIDGFLAERVFGAYALINSSYSFQEIVIPQSTPVHIMFSRKTIPLNVVTRFNEEIKSFVGSGEYKEMVKNYLYSNLFIQFVNTDWFDILSIIGSIGFTVAGFAIATKESMTIFKASIISLIPSSLGLIIENLLIDTSNDVNSFSIDNLLFFVITVIVFYIIVLILQFLNKDNKNPNNSLGDFLSSLIVIGDTIGKSCFFAIGIAASMIMQINPIIIVPIFGVLIAHGGIAIRKLMIKGKLSTSNDELNLEVTFLWSCILAYYCYHYSSSLSLSKVKFILLISVVGCFITRLLTHYLKIPNIKLSLFKSDAH